MPVIPTQSEVKSSSNSLDTTENLTPHDTVREKKSTVLRKRAAHPKSLTLPLEEHPPRKRIRSNMVAAHLNCSIQGISKPSTSIGIEHFGVHPILLVTSHFASWFRTNHLAPTIPAANCVPPYS